MLDPSVKEIADIRINVILPDFWDEMNDLPGLFLVLPVFSLLLYTIALATILSSGQ